MLLNAGSTFVNDKSFFHCVTKSGWRRRPVADVSQCGQSMMGTYFNSAVLDVLCKQVFAFAWTSSIIQRNTKYLFFTLWLKKHFLTKETWWSLFLWVNKQMTVQYLKTDCLGDGNLLNVDSDCWHQNSGFWIHWFFETIPKWI